MSADPSNISVDVAIVGAGQAALALSHALLGSGLRHLCLGAEPRIGDSWRRRWDSLRLFTPAQYDCLPGLPFPAPFDHYPHKDEVADYLESYAKHFVLPVRLDTHVTGLRQGGASFIVTTSQGLVRARQVVLATGSYGAPWIPPFAAHLAPAIVQLHAAHYRRPELLPPGPVVIVGSGASALQIAAELATTRPVTLCVGRRQPVLPQRLLGRDIWFWLECLPDWPADHWLGRRLARSEPVVGDGPRALAHRHGVRLRARVVDADTDTLRLADGTRLTTPTIVWATGHRHALDWVDLPVRDARGAPLQRGGVSPVPGLYFLGLRWMRSRGSSLLGWVGEDAAWIAAQLRAHA